jgi:NAD(P)H-flavin reductase
VAVVPVDSVILPPTAPVAHRVRARWPETDDTVTLDLVPEDGSLAHPAPGQFNMVYAFGVGDVPISVSGTSPGGGILHTIRAVGAVSRALVEAPTGHVLGLRGPYGAGWRLEQAEERDVVVVAGGVGLAPLRPVVHGLLANRDRFGRVVVLIGARSDDLLLFGDEVARWRGHFDVEVDITVDHGRPGWRGHVGVVTDLYRWHPITPGQTEAFVCGPEVMMRHAAAALVGAGVAPASIQVSLERNMQCAVGLCGHCQLASVLLCRDGPVLTWERAEPLLAAREL